MSALSDPGNGKFSNSWWIGILLVLNVLCLTLGLTEDAVTVATTLKKSWGPFSLRVVDERETFSILSSLVKLKQDGSGFLAAVILVFSVLFPIAKLGANIWIWGRLMGFLGSGVDCRVSPLANALHWLGRWSMLDVFVVGILVVWGKLGEVTRFIPEPGLYWFFGAVILSLLNALLTEHWAKHSEVGTQETQSVRD